MPMRRAIGISLACLVISAGAVAKTPNRTPERSTSFQSAHADGVNPARAEVRTGKTRPISCGAVRGRDRYAASSEVQESAGPPDAYLGPVHTVARMEIGKAAWYNRVGAHTSSGEVLDTVTATAAHRSLPLASYAKVTNLDSGRSLIVKINDRGPYTRGRIIDLSPRAAEQLEMKQAGVVPVVVEPVEKGNELGPQRPAPSNQAAATPAAATAPDVRGPRAEVAAIKASPAPAWVDPRIEGR